MLEVAFARNKGSLQGQIFGASKASEAGFLGGSLSNGISTKATWRPRVTYFASYTNQARISHLAKIISISLAWRPLAYNHHLSLVSYKSLH